MAKSMFMRIVFGCILGSDDDALNNNVTNMDEVKVNGDMFVGNGSVTTNTYTTRIKEKMNLITNTVQQAVPDDVVKFFEKILRKNGRTDLRWTTPKENESEIEFVVKDSLSFILALEYRKAIWIKVIYPSGKIQDWISRHAASSDVEADITYVFKMESNDAVVRIGLVYESGNMQAKKFEHSGETFVYLPRRKENKLQVTYYDRGEKATEYVNWQTNKDVEKDCHGGKRDQMHLEGRLLDDRKYFNDFIDSFQGVLTSKNIDEDKFKSKIASVYNATEKL